MRVGEFLLRWRSTGSKMQLATPLHPNSKARCQWSALPLADARNNAVGIGTTAPSAPAFSCHKLDGTVLLLPFHGPCSSCRKHYSPLQMCSGTYGSSRCLSIIPSMADCERQIKKKKLVSLSMWEDRVRTARRQAPRRGEAGTPVRRTCT